MKFDYLIIGSGLSGSVIAEQLTSKGKTCCVVERRKHTGGNLYCEDFKGITVHKYGAHIFRTNDFEVWQYINCFDEFNNFINSPIANYNGEIYNLPFNMNTFHQIYGVRTPEEARQAIEHDLVKDNGDNLEGHILRLVGSKVYEKLIKGYTEKQWGKSCRELPANIMNRIPIRFTYDNNYFNERYQGIPVHGYNRIIEKMLNKSAVLVDFDYKQNADTFKNLAHRVIYTGSVDELYDYEYGALEYRGLRFVDEVINTNNAQGVAVVNYTSADVPYTRTIEHKHFLFGDDKDFTVVTKEYPEAWEKGKEQYYPVPTKENIALYGKYRARAEKDGYILCGRLAEYRYYDMQDAIKSALKIARDLLDGYI